MSAAPLVERAAIDPARVRWDRWRRRLAVGAALTTIPYSLLKIAWLCGSRVGLADPSFGTSGTMHLLNGVTLGLDLVALGLAGVFCTGARAPEWFVLPTMWVGYGLLGQILLVTGPAVVIGAFTAPADSGGTPPPIDGWVYAAVYTGFSGLGLCLLPAFAIYAWQRWGRQNGWGERLSGVRRDLPKLPIAVATAVAVGSAARAVFADSPAGALNWAVDALIGALAVAAIRAGVTGRPRRLRRAVPLLTVWTASGAWAAWGCYHLILGTVPNDLVADPVAGIDIALAAAKVAGGLGLLTAIPALSRLSRR